MQGLDFVDSNVLIRGSRALRRTDEGADNRAIAYVEDLKEWEGKLPKAAIPAIVLAEVLAGLESKEERDEAMKVLQRLVVVPFDAAAAHVYAQLRDAPRKTRKGETNGRVCAHADAMIAATAIANRGARLVTFDPSDYDFAAPYITVTEPPSVARQDPIAF